MVSNKTLSVSFVTLALNEDYIMMMDFGGGKDIEGISLVLRD
jgi:hypothetical protein